jgi:hypothetical protein
MADFAPIRTGQLVVRFHSPWRRSAFVIGAALGAIVFLYIMYEWGRFEGGYSKFAEIQHRRELAAKIDGLEDENEKLRAQVAAAELARSVDKKSYAEVEKTLADLQAQLAKHRDELTFYRGIVAPEDGIGGLRIQRFQVFPSGADHHYRLHLMLAQSIRQDAVASGSVVIQIEGAKDNRPMQLNLAEVGGTSRPDGLVPFQFRYFQNLEQDIALPDGFEPRAVNVEVRSSRLAPVRESYPWQVQIEG